jgi:nitrogenase iron protein
MRIGVYGKGGIGKSTISAGLAAAFADDGARVLQIGCDPKHDSTRLLLHGRSLVTVMDYLRRTPPEEQRAEHVMAKGYKDVVCVEAGGPEPGVGCAGRGILSAFSLLERLGVVFDDYDVTLFDVLGDVVCGGFAVPLRRAFADTVLVVTSEEFMSLYAANNILRGVRNMDQGRSRALGLVLNRRERNGDIAHVQRFAKAVGVPLLCTLPRSSRFAKAEAASQTVVEIFPDSEETGILRDLVKAIGGLSSAEPRPLSDDELERLVFADRRSLRTPSDGTEAVPPGAHSSPLLSPTNDQCPLTSTPHHPPSTRFLSKSLLTREPLHGCAFAGAVNTLTQIADAVTVAHGPRSCVHIAASTMLSSGMGSLARYGTVIPEQLHPRLVGSDMNESAMIHGGAESLAMTLAGVRARHAGPVFVVTTCPAGVIGDDVDAVLSPAASASRPVLRIRTDGNIEGDYLQGVINACLEGASALIGGTRHAAEACVNIVAEKNIALNADANFAIIQRLLGMLDLRVNCRFVRRTSVASLRDYLGAPLNLPAYNEHWGRILKDFLVDRFACRFAASAFPSGFHETEHWLREIAAFFSRSPRAEEALDTLRSEYDRRLSVIAPALKGKRLLLVAYNHDVDWILETAFDVGMEVVKVGIVDYSQDGQYRTRYPDRASTEIGYDPERRADDIAELKPDLVLGNYQSPGLPLTPHYDTIPLCPDVGHLGGLLLAERWARLLRTPLREGWRVDAERVLSP